MACKKGFLGVLTADSLPVSHSLSSDAIWSHRAAEPGVLSCPLQHPMWVICQMPPRLPRSVWQINQVGLPLLLGILWMWSFLPTVVFGGSVPLPQADLFLAISIVGPRPWESAMNDFI